MLEATLRVAEPTDAVNDEHAHRRRRRPEDS